MTDTELIISRLDRIDNQLQDIRNDVAELKADVAELKTDVAMLKADVAELKADVATLKTDVAMLKDNVATLNADMIGVKANLSVLNGDVKSIREEMHDMESRLNANMNLCEYGLHQEIDHVYDIALNNRENIQILLSYAQNMQNIGAALARFSSMEDRQDMTEKVVQSHSIAICELQSASV